MNKGGAPMELYIYFIGVLLIILSVSLIIGYSLPRKSPYTFPDDKFLATWKRYSTMEIAKALDEIGDDV